MNKTQPNKHIGKQLSLGKIRGPCKTVLLYIGYLGPCKASSLFPEAPDCAFLCSASSKLHAYDYIIGMPLFHDNQLRSFVD